MQIYSPLLNHYINTQLKNSIYVLKYFSVFNETFFHFLEDFFVFFYLRQNYFTYPRVYYILSVEVDEISFLEDVLVEFYFYTFIPKYVDYLSIFGSNIFLSSNKGLMLFVTRTFTSKTKFLSYKSPSLTPLCKMLDRKFLHLILLEL